MKTVSELLFTAKKSEVGNRYSEISQFLHTLRSRYTNYIDFEIMEQDDLSTLERYGLREETEEDTKKCYIIVEESWDYNDEYYYQPEGDPYKLHSLKLYTREEAEKVCAEKNKEQKEWFTQWDDDSEEEKPIKPYKIIKLEI